MERYSLRWRPLRDIGRHWSKPSSPHASLKINLIVVWFRLKCSGPSYIAHLANIWGNTFHSLFFSLNLVWWWCWQGLLMRRTLVWITLQLATILHVCQACQETFPFSAIQDYSGPCAHSFCMNTILSNSRWPLQSSWAQTFWFFCRGMSLGRQRSLKMSAEINGTRSWRSWNQGLLGGHETYSLPGKLWEHGGMKTSGNAERTECQPFPGVCNSTLGLWLEAASRPACGKHQISAPLQDQKQVMRNSAFSLESSASSKTLHIQKKKTYTQKTFRWPPSRCKKQSEKRKETIWTLTFE